jgi:hypothetical protein
MNVRQNSMVTFSKNFISKVRGQALTIRILSADPLRKAEILFFAFFERMRAAKIFISTARGSTRLHSQLFVKNICYP